MPLTFGDIWPYLAGAVGTAGGAVTMFFTVMHGVHDKLNEKLTAAKADLQKEITKEARELERRLTDEAAKLRRELQDAQQSLRSEIVALGAMKHQVDNMASRSAVDATSQKLQRDIDDVQKALREVDKKIEDAVSKIGKPGRKP